MSKPGNPLHDVPLLLAERQLNILRALSITTLEDLDGVLCSGEASRKILSGLLEISISELSSRIVQAAGGDVRTPSLDAELLSEEFTFGAEPPYGREPLALGTMPSESPGSRLGAQYDLRDCFGPPRDQGQRRTCVAQVMCGIREFLHYQKMSQHISLSPQFVYWNCKNNDGLRNTGGTWLRVASYLLTRDGVCIEADWPYSPFQNDHNEGQGPPPSSSGEAAAQYRTRRGIGLHPKSVVDIQNALQSGYPVAISIPVFDNWHQNPQVRLDGEINMPLPSAVSKQGHSLLVVGSVPDDSYAGGGCFIVRNSWGTRWARESRFSPGYGTLPFDYLRLYGWEAYTAEL